MSTSRRGLFACACLGMLAFGIVLTTLGSVLPSIIERFGIDKTQAGALFLLVTLGARFSQTAIIAGVGALVAVPLFVIAISQFPASKHPQGFPLAAAGGLLSDPLLLLMGMMLFLESGLEITVGGWTSTFVNEELAVVAEKALIILSLYWLGMMLARIALGSILKRTSHFAVLYFCLAIALIGSALLLTTNNVTVAAIGVFLLGAGFAARFPPDLGFIRDS